MGTSIASSIFVLPATITSRMQINSDLEGVNDVILSAIVGSQLHVETVLESRLSLQSWDCKYFLDQYAFSSMQPGGVYTLEIPSNFIRKDSAFTITVGSTWQMNDAVVIPNTDYSVNYDRGMVYIAANSGSSLYSVSNGYPSSYDNRYIEIKCTTGFKSGDPNDLDTTPPEVIPDWLQEAIIAYVGVIFDTSQTTNRDNQASAIYKKSGDHAMAILSPYLRKRGFVFRPIAIL